VAAYNIFHRLKIKVFRRSQLYYTPILFGLILTFLFGGCAEFKKNLKEGLDQFVEDLRRARLEDRNDAIKKYNYSGRETEIIIDSLLITPYSIQPGEKLKQELIYALLSPQEKKKFIVAESVVLTGKGEKIDLFINESEKDQGVHLFALKLVIPRDIEPGEYNLLSTITVGNVTKTVKGIFVVRE